MPASDVTHEAPQGVLTFTDDGIVVQASAQLHQWLEAEPGSLIGKGVDRLMSPAGRIFYSTHFFPLLRLHGKVEEAHLMLRAASGTDVPVMASAVRSSPGGDGPALNHCALMTIWRRKEFETALVEARQAAEAAASAKDQFLAVVSHELRTPLSAILGWTRLLSTGKLDASMQQRAFETIERNARAQARLIEDLLDVSRIVSGKLRLSPCAVDLAPIVEAAIDTARPSARAKDIELLTVVDRQAGIVYADADRVQQIVWNLTSNAVKFTPKHGRVQVTVRRVDSRVRIEVADTGAGLDAAQIPFVFERFWQNDPNTQREKTGLGLGLSICKSLVELHGGTITAASEGLGRGSVFTVEFPLAVAASASQAASAQDTIADMAEPSLRGIRVLVVDDDQDVRALMRMLLEGAGAEVSTAGSCEQALGRLAEHGAVDVLISDVGMPGRDGYALIREVRAHPMAAVRAMAAVAVTGRSRPEDRVQLLRAGFQSHLVKPVDPAEVVALIRALKAG